MNPPSAPTVLTDKMAKELIDLFPPGLPTASARRFEAALRACAYDRLSKYPELRAEAIARHYVAHANVARDLLALIECHRGMEPTGAPRAAIARLLGIIAQNHRADFGLDLAWPPPPAT